MLILGIIIGCFVSYLFWKADGNLSKIPSVFNDVVKSIRNLFPKATVKEETPKVENTTTEEHEVVIEDKNE